MSHILGRGSALLAVLALALSACGNVGSPDAAATVNDEDIARSTLESRYETIAENPQFAQQLENDEDGALQSQIQAQILTELIEATLIEQGAAERGVEIDQDDIAEQRAALAEQLGGEEQLQQAIEQQGLSDEDIDTLLRDLTYREAVTEDLTGDAEVTDEDVAEYFDENREQFRSAQARHILVETEEEAQEVIDRLGNGEDFAAVAEEVSTDEGSAARGGDLGDISPGDMVPAFEQAVFEDAEVGEVHGPVETQYGFHVIEVTEREEPELAEVEDEIREQLASGEEFEAFDEWLAERREQSEIAVNPEFGQWNAESGQVEPNIEDSDALPGQQQEAPAPDGGESDTDEVEGPDS